MPYQGCHDKNQNRFFLFPFIYLDVKQMYSLDILIRYVVIETFVCLAKDHDVRLILLRKFTKEIKGISDFLFN